MTRHSSIITHRIPAGHPQQPQQPEPPAPRTSISTASADTHRRLIRTLRSSQIASQVRTTAPAPQATSSTTSMAAAPPTSSRPATAAATGSGMAGATAAAASNASPMPLTTPTFTPSTPIVTPSTATASATNSPRFTSASTTTPASNAVSNAAGTSTSGAPATPPVFGTIAPNAANSSRYFGQGTATSSTAASIPTAGSFSFSQPSFGSAAASTPPAGSLWTRGVAASSTFTPSALFNTTPSALTAANNSASTGGLFGQSTATVTPSTATAWTTTTPPTSTGLFGSTESLFKVTNALHNSGRMSVNLDMTWSAAMVGNAEKSFSASFNIKAEKQDDICISCVVKAVEDTFLFQIQFPSLDVMERFDWVKSASVLGMHRRSPTVTPVTRWAGSLMMSISGKCPIEAKYLPAIHDSSLFAASIGLYSTDPSKYTTPLFTAQPSTFIGLRRTPNYCESILGRMLDDHDSHDVFFEFEDPFTDLKQVIDSEIRTDDHSDKPDDVKESTTDPEEAQQEEEKSSEKPVENPSAETTDD
ncbi:hypothetical protein BGZ67_008803, partial [Mortierella alpina]